MSYLGVKYKDMTIEEKQWTWLTFGAGLSVFGSVAATIVLLLATL